VLHPAGPLAAELVTIASQQNISEYLCHKAGSSSLFPTSHSASHATTAPLNLPLPPSPLDLRTSSSSESSSRQLLSLLTSGTESSATKPSKRNDVVTSVCELFQANPHLTLREIYSKVSRSSSHPSSASFSSESTLFILSPHHSELCFLTKQGPSPADCSLEFLFVNVNKQSQWTDYLSSLGGVTVIDGTLSFDHQQRIRKYVCHDIAIMNGNPLLLSAEHSLSQRQELLGVWLFESPFDENILEASIEFVLQRHDG
jgi:hypothetical protein